jgi:hypothetical protein
VVKNADDVDVEAGRDAAATTVGMVRRMDRWRRRRFDDIIVVLFIWLFASLLCCLVKFLSELRRRSALEEMIQQNATQKLFRQEFLKGTYDLMKVL